MGEYRWDFTPILAAWPQLAVGLGYTLLLTVLSFALSVLFGIVVCIFRVSGTKALSIPALGFIELMRLTPLLMQMLWIYTSLALMTGLTLSPFQAGLLALSLNSSAFLAEVFRSGFQSLPRGQRKPPPLLWA